MTEEHNCLILTPLHVPKLRYRDHAKNVSLSFTESLKRDDSEIFDLQMEDNC